MERAIHERNLSADKKISRRRNWDWERDKKRYNLKGRLTTKPALIARIEINIVRLMIRTTCETLHVIVFPIQRKFTLKTLQSKSTRQEPGTRRIGEKTNMCKNCKNKFMKIQLPQCWCSDRNEIFNGDGRVKETIQRAKHEVKK